MVRASCAGLDAGAEQVRRGMARAHHDEAGESPWLRLQEEAREHRRGLWSVPEASAPAAKANRLAAW